MRGIINLDERSVLGPDGRHYEIVGLLIIKNGDKISGKTYEVVYNMETSLCRACIFRGLETNFRVIDNLKGLAYITS